ncbi:MAG TPA: multidrug efflux SMR transporter [Flavipsychrobacter sp.]|nr:multidrug efflux SMR transporter [Flavipsychrobacter sp.]
MGYLLLIATIILEGASVIFMKLSNGFEHKAHGAFAVLGYGLSFFTLTYALKYLPVGIANATWAGASTLLVAVAGIFVFNEQLSGAQIFFLLLIVVGLVGLNYVKAV